MPLPRKPEEPIAARTRNPIDPRENACRERCEAYKIPRDALYEGKPMWARFLNEVEAELKATGPGKQPEGKNC